MAQFPGWMRKNFIPGNSSWRVSGRNMRWKLLQNCVPNTCDISPLKKIFFQISLKYIKLVIPIILFILVLCNFNFYFKITWTPSHQQYNPAPPKMKFSDPPPPPSKYFSKIFNLPLLPQAGGGVACHGFGEKDIDGAISRVVYTMRRLQTFCP